MIDFDYLLSKIGHLGKYQIMILAMVFYVGIPSGLNSIGPVFQSYTPPYRCKINPIDDNPEYNVNESVIVELMIPVDDDGKYDNCSRYEYDPSLCVNGSTDCKDTINTNTTEKCDQYYYDRSLFTETVVTEMDLVCDKAIFSYVATSLYMFGLLIGSIVFGFIADRLGRQPTLIISALGCGVGMIGAGLSHVYWLYVIFRLIIAVFGYGLTISAFVTVMEIVGPQWRSLIGISFQIFFALGYMLLSGVAYGLRDWHNMQWACILLSLPFGIFLFFIPESPRWLFSSEQEDRARKITEKMAKFNNVELTEDVWEEAKRLGAEKSEQLREAKSADNTLYTFKDMFRQPGMRSITFKMMFNWFVNSLVYYGLSLNVGSLSGNIFINNVIGGVMELISYAICILLINRTGRKILLSGMMMTSGVSLIIHTIMEEYVVDENDVVNESLSAASTAFAFLGKMGISGSFAVIYNFTTELFPTVVRSNAVGIGSAAARVGGMVCPFVIATQLAVSWLANSIFGGFAIVAALLCFTFPETMGIETLETLEQAELFYAGKDINTAVEPSHEEKKSEGAEFTNKFYDVDLSSSTHL